MRICRALLVGTAMSAAAMAPAAAGAVGLPPTLGPGGCYDPSQGNADFEAYGRTAARVQRRTGRVPVHGTSAGPIPVFKYPNPSLYNLVKYFTIARDANGRVQVQYPNEGSFAGIRYVTRRGGT